MNKQAPAETTVRAQVVVDAPINRAFAVFTEGIGTWFPPDYNLLRSHTWAATCTTGELTAASATGREC
jgi:uncharacterized protein YndB with AHSA1/START domain